MQMLDSLIIQILVAGKDMALEVLLVRVPELGSLGVQRARATSVSIPRTMMNMAMKCLLVRFA
jgi:hypothetical protein